MCRRGCICRHDIMIQYRKSSFCIFTILFEHSMATVQGEKKKNIIMDNNNPYEISALFWLTEMAETKNWPRACDIPPRNDNKGNNNKNKNNRRKRSYHEPASEETTIDKALYMVESILDKRRRRIKKRRITE